MRSISKKNSFLHGPLSDRLPRGPHPADRLWYFPVDNLRGVKEEPVKRLKDAPTRRHAIPRTRHGEDIFPPIFDTYREWKLQICLLYVWPFFCWVYTHQTTYAFF